MKINSPEQSSLDKQDKRDVVSSVKQLLTRQRGCGALTEGGFRGITRGEGQGQIEGGREGGMEIPVSGRCPGELQERALS